MMYRVGMLAPLLLFAFALISAITVFVLMVLQKIDFNNAMKMLGVSVVSMIIMFWIMLSRMRNRLGSKDEPFPFQLLSEKRMQIAFVQARGRLDDKFFRCLHRLDD